ncbi:MAG: glutaminyl-peptide cyclotransferase [Candidatus Kapaibacteriota bacterium]
MKLLHCVFIVLNLILLFCTNNKKETYNTKPNVESSIKKENQVNQIPVYSIKVIRTIPHDTLAFTQGLLFHNGYLYESTGQYGHSSLRRINVFNGKVEKIVDIEPEYFCEGIALFNNKIYMLTWQNNVCFVYNIITFKKEKLLPLAGEGWGLTNFDQKFLIQSDGTNILKVLEPINLKIIHTIPVFANQNPLPNLNELENIEADIWANIWMSDSIAVIDKATGKVKYFVDASPLRNYIAPNSNIDVLNGVAYDSKTKAIYLTGKFWPYIFEVEVTKSSNQSF